MDYPPGFPPRLRPRLEAEILKLWLKYPLAGDGLKRINESVAAFTNIAIIAVKNGEWPVELAHSGLRDFAKWLCDGYAAQRSVNWSSTEYGRFIDDTITKLTGSKGWIDYLERLAELADKSMPPTASQEQSIAAQLQQLNDECQMTVEELAEGIDIEPRSVYRHLSGEATPRKRHLVAYEKIFSEKLKRQVRLRASANAIKRQ